MQKNRLTSNNIKEDYKSIAKRANKTMITKTLLALFAVLLMVFSISIKVTFYSLSILIIVPIGQVYFCVTWLIMKRRHRAIFNGEYRIVADLLSAKVKNTASFAMPGNMDVCPYTLRFLHLGNFHVAKKGHYESSETFAMNADRLYEHAEIGDKYYLVMCGNDIAAVYNAKMFEPVGLDIETAYIDDERDSDSNEE